MSIKYRKCDRCERFHPDSTSLHLMLPTRDIDDRASKFAPPDAYEESYHLCENCMKQLGIIMRQWLNE